MCKAAAFAQAADKHSDGAPKGASSPHSTEGGLLPRMMSCMQTAGGHTRRHYVQDRFYIPGRLQHGDAVLSIGSACQVGLQNKGVVHALQATLMMKPVATCLGSKRSKTC